MLRSPMWLLTQALWPAEAHSSMYSQLWQHHESLLFANEASFHAAAQVGTKTAAPPTIPVDWLAEVELHQKLNGKDATNPFGIGGITYRFCQDGTNQRMTQELGSQMWAAPVEFVGTPSEWLNQTTYQGFDFMAMEMNENKYWSQDWSKTGFKNMFSWVPVAHDGGVVVEEEQQLHRWFLISNTAAANVSLELLVDEDASPVVFSQNVSMASGPYRDVRAKYVFKSFSPGQTLPELWKDFNITEFTHPESCPISSQSPEPVTKTMYIFHPKEEFNIAGQDLGNDLGDTVFVCLDAMTNFSSFGDHAYAWLTKWEIELVPHYGQYQNCNGYNPPSCISQENFLVGHEAAYYLGPVDVMTRQCGENPKVGEWYSLPVGGECKAPGSRPGDGTCTWKKNHVKTIDGQCLIHSGGLKDSCVREKRAPFPDSHAIFLKAFDNDDPKSGGCPALPYSGPTLLV